MQRRSSYIQAGAALIVWAVVVCAANACKAPDDTAPKTTTSGNVGGSGGSGTTNPGGPPVGQVSDAAGFAVGITGANVQFPVHDATDTTTWTAPCKVPQGASGNASNLTCIIEGPELDMYFGGLTMVYNVPTTMCKYLEVLPYWFYAAPVGTGPNVIEFWIGANGPGIDNNNDGTVDALGSIKADIGDGNGLTIDPTFTEGGVGPFAYAYLDGNDVRCAFDGSNVKDGQNCCVGSYVKTVHTWIKADQNNPAHYDTTTAVTDWGGRAASCARGPAVDLLKDHSDADGLPTYLMYHVDGTGLSATLKMDAPMDPKHYFSDVYIANYFDPANHPTRGVPWALATPIHPATLLQVAASPNPYYDFRCLDESYDMIARIRVQVRKWNTYSEWLKKGTGNPNIGGFETPPYNGFPYDDLNGWIDFGDNFLAAFPGEAL